VIFIKITSFFYNLAYTNVFVYAIIVVKTYKNVVFGEKYA